MVCGTDDIARLKDFIRRARGLRLITRIVEHADLRGAGVSRGLHDERGLLIAEMENVTSGGDATEISGVIGASKNKGASAISGENLCDIDTERGGNLGRVKSDAGTAIETNDSVEPRRIASE